MGRDETIFEGKNLDDAVRKGLHALGMSRAEVMITVLEEGSGGFLGLGARPYKVRVVPRPGGAIREPDARGGGERRDGRERAQGRGGRARGERSDRGGDRGERSGHRGGRGGPSTREERGRGEPARARSGEGRGPRRDEPRSAPRDEAPRGPARNEGGRGPRRDEEPRGRRDDTRGRRDDSARGPAGDARESAPREMSPRDMGPRAPRDTGDRDAGPRDMAPRDTGGRDAGPRDMDRDRPSGPMQLVPGEGAEEGGGRRRRRRGGRGQGPRPGRDANLTPSAHATSVPVEFGSPPADFADAHMAPPSIRQREMPDDVTRGGMGEPTPGAMPVAELEREGVRLTEELLGHMGYTATVTAKAEDTRVDVHASVAEGGDDLAGRKGEVRQALQHILNRMLNKGGGSMYHLQLEVNDFWERREQELGELARQLAEDAVGSGGEAVTEYLNAQERRIIHVTLREDTRVKTYALGTGLIKRVAVAPADFPEPEHDEG